jgi:hypothetical protein
MAIIQPLSPEDTDLLVSLLPWMTALPEYRLVAVQLHTALLPLRSLEQDGPAPSHINSEH